jgi:hypothetical protein
VIEARRDLFAMGALLGCTPGAMMAQSSFPGFIPGNLVVTRTVYTGDATTATVGQPLPPLCPPTAEWD